MCWVYVTFGVVLASMAPLVDEVSADLGLSRAAMGSILGAWALIYIGTAIPAGAWIDRVGLRRGVTHGIALMTLSSILRAVAPNGAALFAAVAVFGIGGPLISVGAPKLIGSLFDEQGRRLPVGLVVASPTLGSAVTLALTEPVLLPLGGDNWRGAMWIAAACTATGLLLWPIATASLSGEAAATSRTDRSTFYRLLRLTPIRFVLGLAIAFFGFSHATQGWLVEVLTDAGSSDDTAGYLASMTTAVGVIGAIVVSRAVPPHARLRYLALTFAALAAAALLLTRTDGIALVLVLVALGLFRSGVVPLIQLHMMGLDRVNVSDLGAANGLFFSAAQIGGFGGPAIFGVVSEGSGFEGALGFLAVLAAAGSVGALAAHRDHRMAR